MSDYIKKLVGEGLDEGDLTQITRDMAQESMYQLENLRKKYQVDKCVSYLSTAHVFVHMTAFLCINYQKYSLDLDTIMTELKNEIAEYIKFVNEANERMK